MPTESPFLKAKIAASADEVKAYPGEVDSPRTLTIDKFLEEHTLTYKSYAAGATLKSGEWANQSKLGETFTLPLAATANQLIMASCATGIASCKVTTSGGAKIYGDFLPAAGEATITLAGGQHVTLQSDGTNWAIIAGEPKREQKYVTKVFSIAEAEAGVEPSATRPAFVSIRPIASAGAGTAITVGGVSQVGGVGKEAGSPSASIFVPPGQKWSLAGREVEAATLLL